MNDDSITYFATVWLTNILNFLNFLFFVKLFVVLELKLLI